MVRENALRPCLSVNVATLENCQHMHPALWRKMVWKRPLSNWLSITKTTPLPLQLPTTKQPSGGEVYLASIPPPQDFNTVVPRRPSQTLAWTVYGPFLLPWCFHLLSNHLIGPIFLRLSKHYTQIVQKFPLMVLNFRPFTCWCSIPLPLIFPVFEPSESTKNKLFVMRFEPWAFHNSSSIYIQCRYKFGLASTSKTLENTPSNLYELPMISWR